MLYIGIDFGGMSIKGGLVNDKGEILFKSSIQTKPNNKSDEISDDLVNLIEDIISKSSFSAKEIASIGIGFPGSVDSVKGIIRYTPNVNFNNYPIVNAIQERLKYKIPVIINNDANCAALGEAKFGKERVDNAVLVTLGTGVGTGIIIGGKVFEGFNSMGAEGGHIRIMSGGEECGCGNKGCFEAYASASALIKQTKKAIEQNPDSLLLRYANENGINGKTAFDASRAGDKVAMNVVNKYIEYVGDGIISLVNLFGSEYVIVGGGISHEGDYLIKPLSDYVNRYKYANDIFPKTKVITASLYNDAGIIGAAALGMSF